jgi:chemotaxis protein methyltransferase CheR
MKPDDFAFLSDLVKSRSGLVLTRDKAYLLESRLMPLARKRNMKGVDELVRVLRARRDEGLARDVTEAMTINESFFFRDIEPFDLFRNTVLPIFRKSRADTRSMRIWSAAACCGPEPYTIAMVLKEEAAKLAGWRIEILGTDISGDMVAKARAGVYSQFEVQRGLPITLLVKYFKKQGEMWQIDPSLRAMVQYQEHDLLHDLRPLGRFDVVFCRNVLIYFDPETKTRVLEGIARVMPPDGLLFLGGAETVIGVTDRFKPVPGQRGIFCLNRDPASAAHPESAASGAGAR